MRWDAHNTFEPILKEALKAQVKGSGFKGALQTERISGKNDTGAAARFVS
jgi:hypothetical protein